jgi:hypothetical protein
LGLAGWQVHGMLLHHWNHFVPSSLPSARAASVSAGAPQHFLQLLQTVGACFESEAASPALYGYNLAVRACMVLRHADRQLMARSAWLLLPLPSCPHDAVAYLRVPSLTLALYTPAVNYLHRNQRLLHVCVCASRA